MKRKIEIISLNDAHTFKLTDTGVDRDGNPTSGRQNVQRTLANRTNVDGASIPIFRVVSVGPWIDNNGRAAVLTEDQQAIHGDFDDKWLNPSMLDDSTRSKKWSAERAKRIEKSAERRRFAEMEAQRATSSEVATAIVQMVHGMKQSSQGGPQGGVRK